MAARKRAERFEYRNPYMTKDIANIIFKVMILHRIKKGNMYSYALVKEFDNPNLAKFLKRSDSGDGAPLIKNDIYNTVNALQRSGYVRVRSKVENGRLKKYYRITGRGEDALREAKGLFLRSMKELNDIVK